MSPPAFRQANVRDTAVGKCEWIIVEEISDRELPTDLRFRDFAQGIKHEIREADVRRGLKRSREASWLSRHQSSSNDRSALRALTLREPAKRHRARGSP